MHLQVASGSSLVCKASQGQLLCSDAEHRGKGKVLERNIMLPSAPQLRGYVFALEIDGYGESVSSMSYSLEE